MSEGRKRSARRCGTSSANSRAWLTCAASARGAPVAQRGTTLPRPEKHPSSASWTVDSQRAPVGLTLRGSPTAIAADCRDAGCPNWRSRMSDRGDIALARCHHRHAKRAGLRRHGSRGCRSLGDGVIDTTHARLRAIPNQGRRSTTPDFTSVLSASRFVNGESLPAFAAT